MVRAWVWERPGRVFEFLSSVKILFYPSSAHMDLRVTDAAPSPLPEPSVNTFIYQSRLSVAYTSQSGETECLIPIHNFPGSFTLSLYI